MDERETVPENGPACPITGCGAIPQFGGPELKCRGYGSTDPLCMANWFTIDPEDAGTYGQYLAHEANECGADCPYTTVHASDRHRAGQCDPMSCGFPHPPPSA
jgi:hypothetical protein